MPLHFVTGNLLESPAIAHVNAVNTVGVMGGGIALAFKNAYPEMFRVYRERCSRNEVVVGTMDLHVNGDDPEVNPEFIVNFPTKKHWRDPSEMNYIINGLINLIKVVHLEEITSIAIPPLGCGLGGLDEKIVVPFIVQAFEIGAPEVDLYLYAQKPATKR